MESILELFYDMPRGMYDKDSDFVKFAKIRNENYEMLQDSMTEDQQDLLGAYFDADGKVEGISKFDMFQFAFHLGAALMAEITEGKEALLGK